ncbi:MAG: type I-U CRISPR-associated helicase/endonuclease Cas3 [Planctomycetaceae bacterium]|nr:type I-U CRISPR-associated helicase/endonuclease Cas3 [Planctomycetaceae bacterium]
MTAITIDRFSEYFRTIHECDHEPYSWQCRLAERIVRGDWPRAIDLPTGSGKTACLDIAIFALACQAELSVEQRTVPRRLFFCVNRRVIVDEAFERASSIARKIRDAEQNADAGSSILSDVARALRKVAGTEAGDNTPPLDVLQLRGGMYRDNRWARSLSQPTVICTTIDQLGSRLLFRGYGVSAGAAPIQAALIAYDSLVLLDEAHISQPFQQTLEAAGTYLDVQQPESPRWSEERLHACPLRLVPMTATPPAAIPEAEVIRLDDTDRENEFLSKRLVARKTAQLREEKNVTTAAVQAATAFAAAQPSNVGLIVNRVSTAKQIHAALSRKRPEAQVELVIGSMRPVDRVEQSQRLSDLLGPQAKRAGTTSSFVVATQCLEVGADYDFDALVTECASLDALRQRFGRLNRGGREIDARAVILMDEKAAKTEPQITAQENSKDEWKRLLDPVYGNALARTWNWLQEHAATYEEPAVRGRTVTHCTIDFGIDAFDTLLREATADGRIPTGLLAPAASLNAPVMLPAYLDLWCQAAPRPVPDPDVALFLHGPQGGEPDVQLCWRADLIETDSLQAGHWPDVVSLLPPTSAECMRVPISRVRRWLKAEADKAARPVDDYSDLEGVQETEEPGNRRKSDPVREDRRGVLWQGTTDSRLMNAIQDLKPGDTLVLPLSAKGWNELGHIPELVKPGTADASGDENEDDSTADISKDAAEQAFCQARDRAALRLHGSLRRRLPKGEALDELFRRAADQDEPPSILEWRALLAEAAAVLPEGSTDRERLTHLASPALGITCEPYPDGCGVVLTTRKRLGTPEHIVLPALDDGEDTLSRTQRKSPVLLSHHTQHVEQTVLASLGQLPLARFAAAFELAARLHDLGKADPRFQAMLRRTDCTDIFAIQTLLAKSGGKPLNFSAIKAARERADLPEGFRHEMLSVQLAEQTALLSADHPEYELILHLIAAHHGYARPFAPVVIDDEPPGVSVNEVELTTADRLACPPHRLDSGVPERFWSLTRRFGWWGLAYLEAVLRLGDQQASSQEDREPDLTVATQVVEEVTA